MHRTSSNKSLEKANRKEAMSEDTQDINNQELEDQGENLEDEVFDEQDSIEDSDNSEEIEEKEESQEPEEKLTEKGTKLDSNEKSALHQQLANERRARLVAEERLAGLAQAIQQQRQEAEASKTQKPFIDPTQLRTADDVANALNQVFQFATAQKQAFDSLQGELGSVKQASVVNDNINSFTNEVAEVRGEFDELNPKKQSYSKELDNTIASLYQRVAYDNQGRLLLNRPPFADFARVYMDGIKKARQIGSDQAQTRVIQKQAGARVGSPTKVKSDNSDNLSPTDYIAMEMEKMGL